MLNDDGVVIPTNGKASFKIEIETGNKYIIDLPRPYRFIIETKGGTIIEGQTTMNTPIAITAGSDDKEIKITINLVVDDEQPIRIVK